YVAAPSLPGSANRILVSIIGMRRVLTDCSSSLRPSRHLIVCSEYLFIAGILCLVWWWLFSDNTKRCKAQLHIKLITASLRLPTFSTSYLVWRALTRSYFSVIHLN